jgi:hypothetical protein
MIYLFGCFPAFHLIFGIVMLVVPMEDDCKDPFPAKIIACMMIFFAAAFIAAAWTLATLIMITGCKLAKMKSYLFCIVIAGVECIFMPIGTVLGVLTIILLSRPSVKELFNTVQTEIQS